jgi:hypothetical protein
MLELMDTIGFGVRDPLGQTVGRVEVPLYGSGPEVPDALAIRSGRLVRRHFIVPANAIAGIDTDAGMIDLHLDRDRLRRFF